MVSRVMQELIALTSLRQLTLVDIRVGPVQRVLPEMGHSVLVGASMTIWPAFWKVKLFQIRCILRPRLTQILTDNICLI